jgi:hypothetical protein
VPALALLKTMHEGWPAVLALIAGPQSAKSDWARRLANRPSASSAEPRITGYRPRGDFFAVADEKFAASGLARGQSRRQRTRKQRGSRGEIATDRSTACAA